MKGGRQSDLSPAVTRRKIEKLHPGITLYRASRHNLGVTAKVAVALCKR